MSRVSVLQELLWVTPGSLMLTTMELYQGITGISLPVVAVVNTRFSDVDYDGTIFVHKNWNNDWVGVVFSFQVE